MVVIGEASNGADAVTEAQRLSPLIALIDISMPGCDGISVTQTLSATCPGLRIIAVTRHSDQVFVTRMLHAGADGYVLKQSPPAELLRAMRAVATGEQYIDASLRVTPSPEAAQPLPAAEPEPDIVREPLSPVEERVLQLLARPCSNQ